MTTFYNEQHFTTNNHPKLENRLMQFISDPKDFVAKKMLQKVVTIGFNDSVVIISLIYILDWF